MSHRTLEPTMPWESSSIEVSFPERLPFSIDEDLGSAMGREVDLDADLDADLELRFTPPRVSAGDLAGAHEHVCLLPRQVAETHLVLPFRMDENQIHVAMADTTASHIVEELAFVTGKTVVRSVTDSGTLRNAIAEAYGTAARTEAQRRAAGFRIAPSRNSSRAFAAAVVLPDR